jgi:hypothetical protein
MHYRKSSPNPPRLLLRIVAAAGAGAVVGACSSGSGQGESHLFTGSIGSQLGDAEPSDADVDGNSDPGCGVLCCGFCGSTVGLSQDAGEASSVGGGLYDAGADHDAELPCGTGVCGSVVSPTLDAGEASTTIVGIMVRPEGGPDQ